MIRTDYTVAITGNTLYITFTDAVVLEKVARVVNVTKNVVIYTTETQKTKNIARLTGNVLSFDFLPSKMEETDQYAVEYTETTAGGGGGGGDASAANQVTQTNRLIEIRDKLIASPATEAKQDSAITELTAIKNKLIASPATEAKQDSAITELTAIKNKIIASPATEAKQDSAITELTAIKNKIIASPATEATLQEIDVAIGSQADASATDDTGSFSVIAFIKRILVQIASGLLNWSTLLGRIPTNGNKPSATSLPVTTATETATGTITTQNLVPNGSATANSAVEVVLNGAQALAIQVTGTYTGALSLQVTNDGSRWETITQTAIINVITGVPTATIASAAIGVFEAKVGGFLRARITGLAAMTGSATVTLRTTLAPTVVTPINPTGASLNATVSGTVTANIGTGSIAAGTNAIGDVGQQYRTSATGAGSSAILNCPATPAAQSIKGTAGRLIGFYAMNSNTTTPRWLKIFNVASPTLGTTAAVLDIPIPPSNNPIFINFEGGIGFSTAIVVAVTAAKGTTNNGAVTLDDVSGFLVFA